MNKQDLLNRLTSSKEQLRNVDDVKSFSLLIREVIEPLLYELLQKSPEALSSTLHSKINNALYLDLSYKLKSIENSVSPIANLKPLKTELDVLLNELTNKFSIPVKEGESEDAEIRYELGNIIAGDKSVTVNRNSKTGALCKCLFALKNPHKGISWVYVYEEVYGREEQSEDDHKNLRKLLSDLNNRLKAKGIKPPFKFEGGRKGTIFATDNYGTFSN